MCFKVIDKKLLKKYAKIWEKISSLMNMEFDSESVYGDRDKYIKTKIKSYGDKVNTNFQGWKIPKENASSYKYLSLIMLDSVIRVNKKHYPQTLLEERKCKIKEEKNKDFINDDFDSSSSNESDNESDNKSKKPSKKSDNDKSKSGQFVNDESEN